MFIQETHMKKEGILYITSTESDKCDLYYSGDEIKTIHGVGINVEYKEKYVYTYI